jgi:hypothetical protein
MFNYDESFQAKKEDFKIVVSHSEIRKQIERRYNNLKDSFWK